MKNIRQKTKAVRAGQARTPEGEHSDPIFATSSFVFDSAEHAANVFAEQTSGNVYSRFTNPTVRAFEQRLASLEGAQFCTGTASGMSAILSVCMTVLRSGDRIAATRGLFGSTVNLFTKILTRFNITTDFYSPDEIYAHAVSEDTRMIFIESPSNPLCEIVDIARLAAVSQALENCILVVDNCACTPYLQQPLVLGADVVVHSSTKYLDGQGRAVGGAVVTNDAQLAKGVYSFLRTAGPSMSPFNAWIFHKGLETLAVRMNESCANAGVIAQVLQNHSKVVRVHYPGLISHPDHALAAQQQSGFGALLAFEVMGGKAGAWSVIDQVEIFSVTANLGDVKSTITHPASTTHAKISESDRERMGITESLIRLSIGLEDVEDLVEDLDSALAKL